MLKQLIEKCTMCGGEVKEYRILYETLTAKKVKMKCNKQISNKNLK